MTRSVLNMAPISRLFNLEDNEPLGWEKNKNKNNSKKPTNQSTTNKKQTTKTKTKRQKQTKNNKKRTVSEIARGLNEQTKFTKRQNKEHNS